MNPSYKLYYAPGLCSLAAHILLRETGATFTLEKVDVGTHRTADGSDYHTINSKGQVPVLELDDGTRLTEGPVIAQFVADRASATALMPPAGSLARYRVMEWQNFITSDLHKAFFPLFHAKLDAAAKKFLTDALRKKFEWVDGQLAAKIHLTGETFTAADAYLFVVMGWARLVSIDLADLKHLAAFRARVAARPAVQAAMQAEGLLK